MTEFLELLVSPFYILFGSWNFFTMTIVGVVALSIIGVFINIITFRN